MMSPVDNASHNSIKIRNREARKFILIDRGQEKFGTSTSQRWCLVPSLRNADMSIDCAFSHLRGTIGELQAYVASLLLKYQQEPSS